MEEQQLTKAEIYDAQIAPLIDQILEICSTNNIAMIVAFSLKTPWEMNPDGTYGDICSSFVLGGNTETPNVLSEMYDVLSKAIHREEIVEEPLDIDEEV